jgi:hypothetical protein
MFLCNNNDDNNNNNDINNNDDNDNHQNSHVCINRGSYMYIDKRHLPEYPNFHPQILPSYRQLNVNSYSHYIYI